MKAVGKNIREQKWLYDSLHLYEEKSIKEFYIKKKIFIYACLVIVTMIAGLFSRSDLITMNSFVSAYSGDTLWAIMVYWLSRVFLPNAKTIYVFIIAIVFSFGIEFSQLYQAQWINEIRDNRLGGLVLGFGFKFSDLVCYSVGIIFGVIVDVFVLRRFTIQSNRLLS